jgi:hypothetical protein
MALDTFEDAGGLARLRARLAGARPTYHAFEQRGEQLLYDLWSGTMLRLDRAAFELLSSVPSPACTSASSTPGARQARFRKVRALPTGRRRTPRRPAHPRARSADSQGPADG